MEKDFKSITRKSIKLLDSPVTEEKTMTLHPGKYGILNIHEDMTISIDRQIPTCDDLSMIPETIKTIMKFYGEKETYEYFKKNNSGTDQ